MPSLPIGWRWNSPRSAFDPSLPSNQFSEQWRHPADVFSVLLILGGDVVGRALAQLAGTGLTPVTFSFGWVSYAVSAIVSAAGENKLVPPPDFACTVLNGQSGYFRNNTSWILGRIVRDYEYWMDDEIRKRVKKLIEEKYEASYAKAEKKLQGSGNNVKRGSQAGLCVSFYRAMPAKCGTIYPDAAYLSGFCVALAQLAIASIPCGVWGDWSILTITAAGIGLAFASGSLPQWKREKWACRGNANGKTIVLTRGNGAQHAIVIQDPDGVGLDLEALASGQANVDVSISTGTRIVVGLLAVLWVLLLISASGIRKNTWFLLAIGGIGIAQNIFVAGWRRKPDAFGIPLRYEKVLGSSSVMKALYLAEEEVPGLGLSMRETFFPSALLRDDEKERWEQYENIKKGTAAPSSNKAPCEANLQLSLRASSLP